MTCTNTLHAPVLLTLQTRKHCQCFQACTEVLQPPAAGCSPCSTAPCLSQPPNMPMRSLTKLPVSPHAHSPGGCCRIYWQASDLAPAWHRLHEPSHGAQHRADMDMPTTCYGVVSSRCGSSNCLEVGRLMHLINCAACDDCCLKQVGSSLYSLRHCPMTAQVGRSHEPRG